MLNSTFVGEALCRSSHAWLWTFIKANILVQITCSYFKYVSQDTVYVTDTIAFDHCKNNRFCYSILIN